MDPTVTVFRLRADVRLPEASCPGTACTKLVLFCPERFVLEAGEPGSDEAAVSAGLTFGVPAGFRGFLVRPCGITDKDVHFARTPVESGQEAFFRMKNYGGGPLLYRAGDVLGALVLELADPPGVLEAAPPAPLANA